MPVDPFFAGPGLDRADQMRGDPDAIRELAKRPDARCLQWLDGAPKLDERGGVVWGRCDGDPPLFLGFDSEAPRFSTLPPGDVAVHARAHFPLLSILDASDAPIFAAALSLANWHRRHGFCSVCGAATAPTRGGWSRACPSCEAEHYPRADPVVIMLASHRGRLLLGRQPAYPPGRYSALAGFVEPGETIEAAVARELHEEAGILVRDVTYVASQPWPFPSSLMIGAHCITDDDTLTIDTTELDDARWFTREEVGAAMAGASDPAFLPPPPSAIAHTLLRWWLDA